MASRQWTDTLGRTISLPLPAAPDDGGTPPPSKGDVSYTLPGIGGAPLTYTIKWRNLKDPANGESVLTNPNQELRYTGDRICGSTNTAVAPYLFQSSSADSICAGSERFNPVVLSEVALPNGQSYRFSYNIYGEIEKITYPIGGYERFSYGYVKPLSDVKAPHDAANRGGA